MYSYNYNYGYSGDSGDTVVITMLLTVYLIILAAVLVFALAGYLFHSFGMYTIGKRMGNRHPWLAFIPFARDYFQGELSGSIPLKNRSIKNPGIWNLLLPIIWGAAMSILIVIFAFGFAAAIVTAERTGNMGAAAGSMIGLLIFYIVILLLAVVYSAVYMVLKILINRQIFARFTTDNMAVVHAVLASVVPLYEAICTFVLRNRDFQPGMEPPMTPPPVPPVYPGGPEGNVPPMPPHMEGQHVPPVPPHMEEQHIPPVPPYTPENRE